MGYPTGVRTYFNLYCIYMIIFYDISKRFVFVYASCNIVQDFVVDLL